MVYEMRYVHILISVLFVASTCRCKKQQNYDQETQKDKGDNSFQHNVDYRLDESGERLKLQSSGKLSNVIDLDNVDGIKRLICVEEKILLVLENNAVVLSWKPGQILLGSAKWGCNSSGSTQANSGGIYAKIIKMYFPTKRRVSIHTTQAGPFDMIEEANIHFHYTPGNREGDSMETRTRRRRYLSNILTKILGNIDWKMNFSTVIPFNRAGESDTPQRYFALHKTLGDRQLSYSQFSTHEDLVKKDDDVTLKCHNCHGRSRISYTFELLIKKVNNEPKLLRYISQLQSDSSLEGDIEASFSKEMALTHNTNLWSTEPEELIRIPVAIVRSLPPVELTLSYTTQTSASIKGYVGGKSKIRASYRSKGNYVISQQFANGSKLAGDVSTYGWNVTDGTHTDIRTKYGVNLTFDVQQSVLFNASISWHEKDISIDLTPPMEMALKPSVHVLSRVEGHSQCVASKVNVTGNFHVSKAELEVEAFGLIIWDVVLHPEISKNFTMTARTVHETCAAHCHGEIQLGPSETAQDVCGKISGRITRQDPRFHELRGLHGDVLRFSSTDDNSTWCGQIGKTCFKCSDNSDVTKLCSDRLVSARMATPLTRLGTLVQTEWPGEQLEVLESWDETSEEHPNGHHDASSLHYEGRAATVAFDVAGDNVVERLAELAVCAGFEYVRLMEDVDHVEVAVKKNGEPIAGEEIDESSKQMFDEAMNTPDVDTETTYCLTSAPSLNVGDTYPAGQNSETEMCGPIQRELYRDDVRDMSRLYHYVFTDVEFAAETGRSWCGMETRLCSQCDPVESTESWDWCSTRMMTPRLAIALRTMSHTASADGISSLYKIDIKFGGRTATDMCQDEIKVLASYHEENSHGNNTWTKSDLYREGRGIMLTTTTGQHMDKLVRHAICAGIDYVRYTSSSYIEGFVLPQRDYQAKLVNFIDGPSHLEVNPPSTLEAEYKYPTHLSNEDAKPLLVDAHYDEHPVSEHYNITDIRDPGKRYLRFDQSLLECLELASDDLNSVIEIVPGSAYRTRSANQNNLDTRHVEEMWRFQAGQAVEIRPGQHGSDRELVELAKSVMRSCTMFLRQELRGIGLGCHSDRLYLDVRPLIDGLETEYITLWNADSTEYCSEIKKLKDDLLKGGPAIAPLDVNTTCSNIPVGEDMTYITFQFDQTELCNAKAREAFCAASRSSREEEVLKLQERMTETAGFGRLPRSDIMPDIKACLLDLCGGCPGAGSVWDRKVKACARMVHKYLARAARPFPDLKDKASFFNTASPVSSVHSLACHDDNVCVESVQLHSIFMPLVTSRYRPNATSSLEVMLFSSEQNPVPILELVEQEMAYKASGKVKVFIEEDKDVSSLRHVLKVLMAYNTNITEIEFHVDHDLDEDLVGAAVQRKIDVWSKNTCPAWSRFAIVPYSVFTIPPSRTKRSLERSKDRNDARSRIHNWEMEWLMKLI